jgi:hypothetical protein
MDEGFHGGTVPLNEDTVATAEIDAASGFARGAATVTPKPPAWNSPTLTELAPVPTAPMRPRRWWIAAVVAVVLLAGGIYAAVALQTAHPSPSAAVEDYFHDLASGDTAAALALVDAPERYAAEPLLNPAALAVAANRPSSPQITGTTNATVDGRAATKVAVTYTVAGSPVIQTIAVVSAGKSFRLLAPFVTVAVTAVGDRRVTVNTVPLTVAKAIGFPGAYAATEAGDVLVTATTAPAVYASSAGAVTATIALPNPIVAPTATAAVQKAVNAALDACVRSDAAEPPHCPFAYDKDRSATVTWRIKAYPQVKVSVVDGAVSFGVGQAGSLHYDAKTSIFFGIFPSTDSGDADLGVKGTATAADSGVTVTFS